MSEPALIQVRNLICQAGGKTMLDMAHWSVAAGERVAIVGHNGAGKSTLLRCLSGFVQPSRGDAVVLGRQLGPHTPPKVLRQLRVEVGQVMQGLHLVQRVSAIDNVLMGILGRRSGWRTWVRMHLPADVAAAEAALSDVGLLSKADERVDRLSGGEKQKVAIARMLMQRPQLILADEPTASLDPLAASEVCSLLARAAAGATLITVVHNPSLLPILADRVLGLKHGRLAFDLPLEQVDDRQLANLYRPDTPATDVPWFGPPVIEAQDTLP